jgi:CrcB protein
MIYFWVGLAGIVGSLLRYGLGWWVQQAVPPTAFPAGTLAVNLIGCFALGWFSRWALNTGRVPPRVHTAISTGLIGSFTTFSTFSVEMIRLFRQGLWGSAFGYAGLSLIGGLALVWLGTAVADRRGKEPRHG